MSWRRYIHSFACCMILVNAAQAGSPLVAITFTAIAALFLQVAIEEKR